MIAVVGHLNKGKGKNLVQLVVKLKGKGCAAFIVGTILFLTYGGATRL